MSFNNNSTNNAADNEEENKEQIEVKDNEIQNEVAINSTTENIENREVSKEDVTHIIAHKEENKKDDEGIEEKKDNKHKKQADHRESQVYSVKWITYNGKTVPIILQNENGPCPLIAIANILFLKQIIQLNSNTDYITSLNLIDYLGDALIRSKPECLTPDDEMNFNQNFNDALNLLHKLEFGLDVNVKFDNVKNFEYTREMNIFDMFNINIYHGWLIDPQMTEVKEIVKNLSYNQLVEKIIYLKNSDSQIDVVQGMQVEEFLDSTQSQLTYHGLVELQHDLKPNELAVFFRNNHFSTILKHNNQLYLLATDQGFLNKSKVVWETLSSIDGDIYYVNSMFNDVKNTDLDDNIQASAIANSINVPLSESADYMLARSIQNQMDEDLANLLQEEEKRQVETEERRQNQRPPQQNQQMSPQQLHEQQPKQVKKKNDKCSIM